MLLANHICTRVCSVVACWSVVKCLEPMGSELIPEGFFDSTKDPLYFSQGRQAMMNKHSKIIISQGKIKSFLQTFKLIKNHLFVFLSKENRI